MTNLDYIRSLTPRQFASFLASLIAHFHQTLPTPSEIEVYLYDTHRNP